MGLFLKDISLKGKTALITGATKGLGRGAAQAIAEAGGNVIAIGRNQSELNSLGKIIKKLKVKYLSFNCDVNDFNSIKRFISRLKSLDILVNNAGITSDNLFIRMKDEEWDKVLDVNLRANVRLTKNIIRGMLKRRFGRIIFISSIIGYTGNIGQSNYACSKSALSGFSKSISLEVANRGITCNLIAPGFIKTPMTDKLNENQQKVILDKIPISRFGIPEDISAACIYLASDEASYLTGTTIHVNGGMGMF